MALDIDVIKLAEKISPYWRHPATIVLILITIAALGFVCFMGLDINQLSKTEALIVAVFCLIILFIWVNSTRLPRAPLNCIGLAIALSAETNEQQKRLNADLVASLKRTLSQGTEHYRFKVIEIPRERAALIQSVDDATKMREETRCKFILWGTARLREIDDVSTHVINLSIQIGHNPIPAAVSKSFSREISEVYPGRLHLAQKNDLMVLEFTSDWLDLVTRYVVGVSLAFSGFVDAAEATFADLYQDARLRNATLAPIRKLKSLNRQRLADIYDWRAGQYYESWRLSRSDQDIETMGQYLSRLRELLPATYSMRLMSSIYHFVVNRDVTAAIADISNCNEMDATWRYNYAFLLAYSGDMERARRAYRSAFERSFIRADIAIQTEEFMVWVLSREPDKGQLHFCLGLVNWHAKKDHEQAVKDFQQFRAAGLETKFSEEFKIAGIYIDTLKGEIAAIKKRLKVSQANGS